MSPDHKLDDGTANAESKLVSVDWTTYDSPATAVAEAVATATERDQTDLEPLQYTIDADALDRIFEDTDTEELVVSFTYEDVQVRVSQQVVEVSQ